MREKMILMIIVMSLKYKFNSLHTMPCACNSSGKMEDSNGDGGSH